MELSRRGLILAASSVWALDRATAAATQAGFSFLHFCEPHITDQLGATEGCKLAFDKMSRLGADFAIAGGDLVYDVCAQGWKRAIELYQLYTETEKRIGIPVHRVMGNHDVYG